MHDINNTKTLTNYKLPFHLYNIVVFTGATKTTGKILRIFLYKKLKKWCLHEKIQWLKQKGVYHNHLSKLCKSTARDSAMNK